MSIVLVQSYVIKIDKEVEFEAFIPKMVKFMDDRTDLFEGVKSWNLYKQAYGGTVNQYIEKWEYESIEDMDKINKRVFADPDMKNISTAFRKLIESTTFTSSIWSIVV